MNLFKFSIFDKAAGRESRSAAIAVIGFFTAAARFLLSDATLYYHGQQIHFGAVDAALMAAFLGPCLALYWGRRNTDARFTQPSVEPPPVGLRVDRVCGGDE